jgi:hypothetical protein
VAPEDPSDGPALLALRTPALEAMRLAALWLR